MKLYVGNLPFTVSDTDLNETFSAFGEVSSVALMTDRFSGRSKGFGFVEMATNSAADAAIKGLNDTNFNGRRIKVNAANPQGRRSNPKKSSSRGSRR